MQHSTPVVSVLKHDSGAIGNDPRQVQAASLSPGSALGGAPAAPGPATAASPQSLLGGDLLDDTLTDVSDLSTEMIEGDSPAQRGATRAARGTPSHKVRASSGPRDARSTSTSKRRPGLRGRMPLSRSPSPQAQRPELRAHQPLETSAVGTTIEERVDKLEEMARRDHLWRDDVAGAVKALAQASDRSYAKLRDYGEAISGFGRVGFDIRSDLNAAKAKLEADLIAGLEEVPTRMAAFFSGGPGVQIGILLDKLGHQVMQLDAKFEVLHEHIGGAAGRETLMAAKLHELDAARPQEGAAIAAALQHQAQQISEIKTGAQVVPSGGSEWTIEKLNLLNGMYRDVSELKNLPGRLKFMEDRLTAA